MLMEIKVPSVGESVTEALLAQWFKKDGDLVKNEEPLFVLETDKITLEVAAEADGVLAVKVPEGETVSIGAVVGTLNTETAEKMETPPADAEGEPPAPAPPAEPEAPEPEPDEMPAPSADETREPPPPPEKTKAEAPAHPPGSGENLAPSVRRLIAEKRLSPERIKGTGPAGRITKSDVILYLESDRPEDSTAAPARSTDTGADSAPAESPAAKGGLPEERISRKTMSPIRQRIAARLLQAKQSTAMLTTFNEIDMTQAMKLRQRYKEAFKQKYGVGLGFMSFFIKAATEALKEFPRINAYIDNKDIIEHHYYHMGVAIGSERGLVVPVIRHADTLGFAELEQAIVDYVQKIEKNRLELGDLEGGTFTISNGGVYGSLLSTPILNSPQSAILGMHKIEKRPVVIDDEVVVRPMMYVALSYDHRIVDGREAVTFLKRIKECVENPERILMEI